MNRTIIFWLAVTVLVACGSNETAGTIKTTTPVAKDSVVEQEALFPTGYTISRQGKRLQLDSLQQGYDSLQIRYWRVNGLYGNVQLYVIKNTAGEWSATAYDLQLDSNYANGNGSREFLHGPAPYNINKSKQMTPSMGWQPFVDSLKALQLMTLPDSKTIPELEIKWTHPTGYYVELATSNHYRYYTYYDPHRFADSVWQANNMMQIDYLLHMQLDK